MPRKQTDRNSLKNLKPPWKRGQSGNPLGIGRDTTQREVAARLREGGQVQLALEQLHNAVGLGESWAIKLTLAYGLGEPIQPAPQPTDSDADDVDLSDVSDEELEAGLH